METWQIILIVFIVLLFLVLVGVSFYFLQPAVGCLKDADCGAGKICRDNQCIPKPCTQNGDCPADEICRNGACFNPTGKCNKNSDCISGQICSTGSCKNFLVNGQQIKLRSSSGTTTYFSMCGRNLITASSTRTNSLTFTVEVVMNGQSPIYMFYTQSGNYLNVTNGSTLSLGPKSTASEYIVTMLDDNTGINITSVLLNKSLYEPNFKFKYECGVPLLTAYGKQPEPGSTVVFYRDDFYQPSNQPSVIPPGAWTNGTIVATNPNWISSVGVHGLGAVAYANADGTGDALYIGQNIPRLSQSEGGNWNDKISSVQLAPLAGYDRPVKTYKFYVDTVG